MVHTEEYNFIIKKTRVWVSLIEGFCAPRFEENLRQEVMMISDIGARGGRMNLD